MIFKESDIMKNGSFVFSVRISDLIIRNVGEF